MSAIQFIVSREEAGAIDHALRLATEDRRSLIEAHGGAAEGHFKSEILRWERQLARFTKLRDTIQKAGK